MGGARWSLGGLSLVALASSVACVADVEVALPAFLPEARAVIVLAEPLDGGRIRGLALEVRDGIAQPVVLPSHTRLTVLELRYTLTELDLVAGSLPSAEEDELARPLPPALVRHRAELDGAVRAWREITVDELPVFELPALTAETCVSRDADGSGARACLDEGGACLLPCPGDVLPEAPAEPELITVPKALTCPAGWSVLARSSLEGELCEPTVALDDRTCPMGQVLSFDAGGCVPVGVACPGDAFAAPPPDGVPAFYVAPGAVGGDGTRGAPFATIDEALGHVIGPARILLAKGAHAAFTSDGADALELVGACAAETTILGASTIARGTNVVVHDVAFDAGLTIASSLVELRGLSITAGAAGLVLSGTTAATLARLSITDGPETEAGVPALSIEAPARATAREVTIVAPRGRGLVVSGAGAEASIEGLFVRDAGASAIVVSMGAHLTGASVVVDGAAGSALDARDPGTLVELGHVVARGAGHDTIAIVEGGARGLRVGARRREPRVRDLRRARRDDDVVRRARLRRGDRDADDRGARERSVRDTRAGARRGPGAPRGALGGERARRRRSRHRSARGDGRHPRRPRDSRGHRDRRSPLRARRPRARPRARRRQGRSPDGRDAQRRRRVGNSDRGG